MKPALTSTHKIDNAPYEVYRTEENTFHVVDGSTGTVIVPGLDAEPTAEEVKGYAQAWAKYDEAVRSAAA